MSRAFPQRATPETPHARRTSGVHAAANIRSHVAIVRSLLDELDRVSTLPTEEISHQVIDELHRLGLRCEELADVLEDRLGSGAPPVVAPPSSGIEASGVRVGRGTEPER